ncbi:hypothetical protein BU24DRAFT_409464 [Aaosphaeria arxii CBS 175.79]|uniref:Ecp2 effector protein domain-containing protein n=1 Tax=Aaosphaeria arxii CBS 175.79 TaxID=1450172 RepID=A0A6A5XTR9_9PLEO|nr:uncharacterized protein BU24DRAFT_409464 [Aaosphaeria arxii CBS 175.79]KAF2016353.1 hypothetical protein BU24DRAFT_409464 [Aaosphaeria arxii CBS 175.79]
MIGLVAISVVCFLATFSRAGSVTQDDFTGVGRIHVLKSDDWKTANPSQIIGCLDDLGRFVSGEKKEDCGVFAHINTYPSTLSSSKGNCSFTNSKAEKNLDSYYGRRDSAWSCAPGNVAKPMDALYTLDGFEYPFLCFGDIACFYDSKEAPQKGENTSLWQFRWGSMQRGVPEGHIQLQLMWEKIGDLTKKANTEKAPSRLMGFSNVLQTLFRGPEMDA